MTHSSGFIILISWTRETPTILVGVFICISMLTSYQCAMRTQARLPQSSNVSQALFT